MGFISFLQNAGQVTLFSQHGTKVVDKNPIRASPKLTHFFFATYCIIATFKNGMANKCLQRKTLDT